MTKFSVDREMRRARAAAREGALREAQRIYQAILEKFPNNARARQALSALWTPGEGAQPVALDEATVNELLSLLQRGQPSLAAEKAEQIASQFPASFQLWAIIGTANERLGRLQRAEAGYRRACELRPEQADVHVRLGRVLLTQGKLEDAVQAFHAALLIEPDLADAHTDLGIALSRQGKRADAMEAFRRALEINPGSFEALNNLAIMLKVHGQLDEAIRTYRQALRIKPDSFECLENLGRALWERGNLADAIDCFEGALRIRPENGKVLADKLGVQLEICDWSAFAQFEVARHTLGIKGEVCLPFAPLALEDCPERQLARATHYTLQKFKVAAEPLAVVRNRRAERIRIGYFSADIREHPMPRLMSGMFREHDRSRFEIFVYSYGPPSEDELRHRISRTVEHFIDVRDMADADLVNLARGHGLDIAIDLMGHTTKSRTRLFALRLAPVQINFLGFPGTMGADFMDYIVADPVVVPEAERRHYTERLLRLPDCYFANDNQQEIARTQTTRADFGLPEGGFVFCCFNQVYKIGPREFDIWMRLLGRVEGSVLWLLPTNRLALANLRKEAGLRGVDPDRLIFAKRLANAEHLARHKHADLFMDTFIYNAHTTANDALWTGLPIVTKAGRQFSARVCASLLTAIGLPELITVSEEAYEALILELATNPARLSEIRAKLAENRHTQPLFDTVRYTRHFESALETVLAERLAAG